MLPRRPAPRATNPTTLAPAPIAPWLALASVLAASACVANPAPRHEPAADAASAAPPAPVSACEALDKPLGTLRRLASVVSLGRSMPIRPLHPDLFIAELDADAARAGAARSHAAATSELASGASAQLAKIAAKARAFSAKRGGDAEPARLSLLEEMERGELAVLLGDERCGKSGADRHSAQALESTTGKISAAALQRAIRAGAGAFRACHQAGLRRDPTLRGAVHVRFVIAPDGAVREASDADRSPPDPLAWGVSATATPLRDAAVSGCVLDAFRKLRFPKPEGGAFSGSWGVELGSSANR